MTTTPTKPKKKRNFKKIFTNLLLIICGMLIGIFAAENYTLKQYDVFSQTMYNIGRAEEALNYCRTDGLISEEEFELAISLRNMVEDIEGAEEYYQHLLEYLDIAVTNHNNRLNEEAD